MRRAVVFWLAVAGVAFGGQIVDQGSPGNQGSWPVRITGGSSTTTIVTDGGFLGSVSVTVIGDGGFVGYTLPQPCSRIVQVNDAGYSTTPTRVPASGPTAGRIWIRVCNSQLNSSSTICTCGSDSCPSSVSASVQGDVLATGDCVTYPLGTVDAGLPCCVCNGAGSFLPSSECVP